MNVIIPAAGLGLRFIAAGYTTPKPFILLHGQPLLKWVLRCAPQDGEQVVVVQNGSAYEMAKRLHAGPVIGLDLPQYAAGAVKTILAAKDSLSWDEPVLVLNSDVIIEPEIGWRRWEQSISANCIGAILTFESTNPAYSYAKRVSCSSTVLQVAEKECVSRDACAGAFWFRSFALLYAACTEHLAGPPDHNGEYYLAPVYNHLIQRCAGYVKHVPLMPEDTFIQVNTPEDVPAAEAKLKELYK